MPFLLGARYRFSAGHSADHAIERRFGQSFSCNSKGGGSLWAARARAIFRFLLWTSVDLKTIPSIR
jgi:hypothetical protein